MPRGGPRPNSGGARPGSGRKPLVQLEKYRDLAESVYGPRLREIMEAKIALALDAEAHPMARIKAMGEIENRMLGAPAPAPRDPDPTADGGADRLVIAVPQEVFDAL